MPMDKKKDERGAAAPEEKKEKKAKKSQKERPKSKKKHAAVQVWKKYKVENDRIVRLNESCPRCGEGTFLAKYKDRSYCGKCGWSKTRSEEKK